MKKKITLYVFILTGISLFSQWQPTYEGEGTSFVYKDDSVYTGGFYGFYAMNINDTIWTKHSDSLEFYLLERDENKIIGFTNKGFYITYDFGFNWQFLDSTWTTEEYYEVTSMVFRNDSIWVTTWDSVCLSPNLGQDWETLRNDYYMYFVSLHNNRIYLSTASGSIEYTTDGGKNWTLVEDGYDNNIYDARFLAFNDSYIFAGGGYYLSRKTYDATEWEMISSIDFTDYKYDGVTDIETYNNILYVATDRNVVVSEDNGNTWKISEDDLFYYGIENIEICGEYMFITNGFENIAKQQLPLQVEDIESSVNKPALTDVNIFPNPFSSEIYINKAFKNDKVTDIKLYNSNGQLQKTGAVISEDTSYLLNTDKLPSGLYILEIKTVNETYFSKIIKKAD